MRKEARASNAPQLRQRGRAFLASWQFAVLKRDFWEINNQKPKFSKLELTKVIIRKFRVEAPHSITSNIFEFGLIFVNVIFKNPKFPNPSSLWIRGLYAGLIGTDLANHLPQAFSVADLWRWPAICSNECCAEPLTSYSTIRASKKWLRGYLLLFSLLILTLQ